MVIPITSLLLCLQEALTLQPGYKQLRIHQGLLWQRLWRKLPETEVSGAVPFGAGVVLWQQAAVVAV